MNAAQLIEQHKDKAVSQSWLKDMALKVVEENKQIKQDMAKAAEELRKPGPWLNRANVAIEFILKYGEEQAND